ncbi:MAG: hypothetical protein JWM33_3868 [Caulobacteraceae bacterium]|nr:hypothetical protein [Caulobacteraceae bacterium]
MMAKRTGRLCGLALAAALMAAGAAFGQGAPEQLAAQAAGVVGSGDQLSLRLRTPEGERVLKIGETYAEGWTLQALSPSKATLAKDGAVREVGLNPTGAVASGGAAAPASRVTVVGAEVAQQLTAAKVGWTSCMDEYRQKTGQDFFELRDGTEARPVLGEARFNECFAFLMGMGAARTPEELALVDYNAMLKIDGAPPMGPDRITPARAATYTDATFPPGAFTTSGYIRGATLADGSFYFYRTPQARQAAIAAGEEPPIATPGMTAADSKAAQDAWIAAHPSASAR